MNECRFETREQASAAAAEFLVDALERQLEAHDRAAMVVSGGSTPAGCFARMAAEKIDWSKVELFLSDERWVPPEHPDSNEKMVRDSLLTAAASGAALHGVYREDGCIDQRCRKIGENIRQLTVPFACVLLGMGADGHFASLFPDSPDLAAGLDPEDEQYCIPVDTVASAHPRISLTLAALCCSEEILLLIFGEDKWQTLQSAGQSSDCYPVSGLLSQTRTPVRVFWAP